MTPEQIDTITRHYAFAPDDKAALTALMADAYLHAKQAAYNRAHTTASKRVSLPAWRPGDADATKAHEWAAPRVDSIAETYESLLRSQLEQMQESSTQEAISDVWGGIKGVLQKIGDWFSDFLGWKTEQIAQDTWNEGDNDGTEQFVEDVIASGMDYSMLKVRVEPGESSSDYCKNFAGQEFSFDDVGTDTCPNFPSHPSCIHYIVVVTPEGDEVSI